MTSKSKTKPRKKAGRSARKAAKSKKGEYPDIIEEPIRVIDDRKRNKSTSAKSRETK